jgi:threonyl-tRNA synthetase
MNNDQLNNLRHSAAHLLATAVMEFYPDAKRTIGPAIENGFYYDFDFGDQVVTEADLEKIENKMRELLKKWVGMKRREVSVDEAKKFYQENPYKLELIEQFAGEGQTLTFYDSVDAEGKAFYSDLCRGGHSENPKEEIGAFKLLSLAGAYWRGDEKNKMLTRIYGTAFQTKEELEQYLTMLEEAKKRDHKKVGPALELFFWHETSPGMTYWLPKGLTIYNQLYGFVREKYHKFGYQEVATPQMNKSDLYQTSGHWSHYRDDMFVSDMGEHEVFGIKPMNCPNAMTIFKYKTRSYNDLPMKLGETTTLHRFELSGTLNGLFRTRMFRQDDAHVFMKQDQVKQVFAEIMQMIDEMYSPFGLSYKLRFGTRPESFLGESADWDVAEQMLEDVLKESGKEYFKADGEGAFYGPKVDILMKDTLGREWQTGTIQLDYQQPKRFELKYTDSDGSEKQPVVMHRAIFGSIERFLGILIEHYAGAFPTWLSPTQVVIIPIADRHAEYGKELLEQFKAAGIRVELDARSEKMQAKIRTAQTSKVPYMIIVGDQEVENKQISVRKKSGENLNNLSIDDFLQDLKLEIANRG